jgi:hypothetical protein
MNRRDFTKIYTQLITEMIVSGETPILDYLLRSDEEQYRLFSKGLSKCDGKDKKSKHQFAKAGDLYFVDKDGNIKYAEEIGIEPHPIRDRYVKWHKRWEELGGKPMIEWDCGHYEV